jgi:hypothetical protein
MGVSDKEAVAGSRIGSNSKQRGRGSVARSHFIDPHAKL